MTYRSHNRRLRNRSREEAMYQVALEKENPCMDCGGRFPACAMDFDHINPKTKSFGISRGVITYSIEEVMDEIAKCLLVCANCHRIRTQKQWDNGAIHN